MTHLQPLSEALLHARSGQAARLDASAWQGVVTTPELAYAVQDEVLQGLGLSTRAPAWKSGGPSRDQPLTHAALPPAGLLKDGDSAAHLPLMMRGIEAEIALKLGRLVTRSMAATLTHDAAVGLVESMAAAVEIVDTRWAQGVHVDPLLKLADHQAHGALVLGTFVPWRKIDWRSQTGSVRIGTQEQRFVGSLSLVDPSWLLPTWLRHATRHGAEVPAGTVVTTGTWCGLLRGASGDEVTVAFEGLGRVRVRL